jgi:hypothetical protein
MDQKINGLTRQLYALWKPPFPVLAVPLATALDHRAVGHIDGRQPCFQASKTGQATRAHGTDWRRRQKGTPSDEQEAGLWEDARACELAAAEKSPSWMGPWTRQIGAGCSYARWPGILKMEGFPGTPVMGPKMV